MKKIKSFIVLIFIIIIYLVKINREEPYLKRSLASIYEEPCSENLKFVFNNTTMLSKGLSLFFSKSYLLMKSRQQVLKSFFDENLDLINGINKGQAKISVYDNEMRKIIKGMIPLLDIRESDGELRIGNKFFMKREDLLGSMNKGIYISEDRESLVKKIDGLGYETLKELYWSLQVEQLGGARFIKASRNKEGEVYLEMERIFYDEDSTSLKDLKINEGKGKDFLNEYGGEAFLNNLVEGLAKSFRDTTKRGIIPIDSDFMVNSKGDIRWIDVGLWNSSSRREDTIIQMDHFLRGFNRNPFVLDFSEMVFERYFELLKKEKILPAEDIKKLYQKYKLCPCDIFELKKEI